MPGQIRAKFTVWAVEQQGTVPNPKTTEKVILMPVYSPDPASENHAFWTATPNGRMEMTINNPRAWGFFLAGQEYFIDFTPVTAEEASDAQPG